MLRVSREVWETSTPCERARCATISLTSRAGIRARRPGVAEVADEATSTARSILSLREANCGLIQNRVRVNGLRLLDLLFERPLVNVNLIKAHLGVAFATANNLVAQFEEACLPVEITGGRRGRIFSYEPYLSLWRDEPRSRVPAARTWCGRSPAGRIAGRVKRSPR